MTTPLITMRLDEGIARKLARYCDENGVTRSDAIRGFVEKGLDNELKEKDPLEVRVEELGETVSAAVKKLENSVKDMELIRKNMGKATQASYGSLSLLAWFYHDYLVQQTNFEELPEEFEDSPMGTRWNHLASASIQDIFRIFESSGGMLQRDPRTDYFHSFVSAQSRPELRDCTTEELFGSSKQDWKELSSQGTEASEIRQRNNRPNKQRKRKKGGNRDGQGND